MTFIPREIVRYCQEVSFSEPEVIQQLRSEIIAQSSASHNMIDPVVGQLLALMVQLQRPERILEVGTFGGYSTLWLAHHFAGTTLQTLDRDDTLIPLAQKYWNKANQDHKIRFHHGDALMILEEFKKTQQKYDFIFVDADKRRYAAYYDLCIKLLNPKGVLIFDNVLGVRDSYLPNGEHRVLADLDAFNLYVQESSATQSFILPMGDGLRVCQLT